MSERSLKGTELEKAGTRKGCEAFSEEAQRRLELTENIQVVKKLVAYNADIHGKGKDGSTPLYIAVQEGHAHIVEYLIKKGGKDCIHIKWSSGYTPLYIAGAFFLLA
jgi:hypothetical protein